MGAYGYRRSVLSAGTTDDRISELIRAIGTINRKAPAFLQGLLSLVHDGAGDEIRTRDILLGRQMLYQLSYPRRAELKAVQTDF